ncbi:RluA family pseudouridine synthase [Patescibacteria group bacterium]|nr:RluA family pseudouridine synthase [Patescibacteria group bacterium]
MKTTNVIKINDTQSNQRIDKFLADFYSKTSRASWQKRIKNEEILVNDRKLKPDYILKKGDKINILEIQPTLLEKNIESKVPEIKIIYEDKDVIVINKPAGILSQSTFSSNSSAISDFLTLHFPAIKEVGQDEQRFGIVHRLDKDTSGVMIVAKNNNSFEFLKDQFKTRRTEKTYTTLVYGIVKPKDGIINLKIGRSKTNPMMQTVIDSQKKESLKSREALTVYKTIETFNNYSLLEVSPKTGRMHQIRVHLKSLGYPVVGDKKYFYKKYRDLEPKLGRQFLHARKLKITIPNGKLKVFSSELTPDLKNFLIKTKHLD